MNLFVVPSWYPHRCHPLHGTFIIEQAVAIGELRPRWNVALSVWGQMVGRVALAHYRASPRCLMDAWTAPYASERVLRENVVEFATRAFSWNEEFLGGNREGILAANRRNLRNAQRRFGRIDLLHGHVGYPGGWVAMRLSEETGIPYVVTEHMGPFPLPVYEDSQGGPKDILRVPLERADARIAVSNVLCDRIASFGIPRPEYVPNVIDERHYALTPRAPEKRFEFFTLGGMEPVKGFDHLLEAIAALVRSLSAADQERVAFRLGGYGPCLATYQKLCRDLGIDRWVSWLGFLPRDRAREEFHRCDCYVLSSRHESFGVVLLEAMATGKPVIATRCGGPESLVKPENGLLVDVGRPDQMAEAMRAIFTGAQRYDAAAIRAAVLAEFSRAAVVDRLEAIYRRVSERSDSGQAHSTEPHGRQPMETLTQAAAEYARSHVANVVGCPIGEVEVDDGLLRTVFREISRTPEVESTLRDIWGNWDFSFGDSNLRGELYTPWLDKPLAERRRALHASGAAPLEPLWPDGKPFALCLTHDVDFITLNPTFDGALRMVRRDLGSILSGPRDPIARPMEIRNVIRGLYLLLTLRWLRPRPERTYDEWIALEGRHGFRSTFFFFPERVSAPHVYDCLYTYDDPMVFEGRRVRVRDFMKELVARGWDVGLHGSYHSALRPGLLAEQKRQIEGVIGRPVRGTRQHWLHYDARITPALQFEAGLEADSTQGFNRNVGFRAGTSFPHWCWSFDRGQPLALLEVPQHVMDGGLFTSNALEYDVDRAVRHCALLMDEVEAVGGCLTLSWHPNNLQAPNYWSVYEAVLAEAARRGAWGCSMQQMYEWWTERSRRIAARVSPKQPT